LNTALRIFLFVIAILLGASRSATAFDPRAESQRLQESTARLVELMEQPGKFSQDEIVMNDIREDIVLLPKLGDAILRRSDELDRKKIMLNLEVALMQRALRNRANTRASRTYLKEQIENTNDRLVIIERQQVDLDRLHDAIEEYIFTLRAFLGYTPYGHG